MSLGKCYLIGVAASCVASGALAGCHLPPAPYKAPDGVTATEPEMRSAMRALKQYNLDVDNYLKCLAFEAQQNRLTREEAARKNNAALDALRGAATRFNEQMRVFKER